MSRTCLSVALFLAACALVAGTPPAAHPAGPALRALPTPTPHIALHPAAVSARSIVNLPVYSPSQFDFGTVWNGQLSKRTLVLTTNAAGYVAVAIPPGPFRIAEFREMGAGGTSAGGGAAARFLVRNVKTRVTYRSGQSGPFQWSLPSGAEVQVDIVFQPKFDLFTMTAGPKSATMKVTGPGPQGGWALSIPMHGTFNGLRIGAVFSVDDKEVMAVQGTTSVNVAGRLTGTDTALRGTVHGSNPPPGIQVGQVPVTVNPGQTTGFGVPLTLSWGALKPDGMARNIGLVFQAGAQSSSAAFSLIPVPVSVTAGENHRTDCGIGWLDWGVILSSSKLILNLSGWNRDLISDRDVMAVVNIGSKPVAWGVLHLPPDLNGKNASHQWDSSRINADFAARYGSADYLQAVRHGATLTCRLVGTIFKPPFN
jgi:hypothetical protein